MKKFLLIAFFLVFAISIAGNVGSLYLLDKALNYRAQLGHIESSYINRGMHIPYTTRMKKFQQTERGIIVGGSLVRYWILPNDFNFFLFVQGGLEEKAKETQKNFERHAVQSGASFALINVGFSEIHTAVQLHRELMPRVFESIDYIEQMVETCRRRGILPIVSTLSPVRPRFYFPYTKKFDYDAKVLDAQNEVIVEFNRRLRDYAQQNRVALIDLHKALVDESGRLKITLASEDGEHLTVQAYTYLSRYLELQLEGILRHSGKSY